MGVAGSSLSCKGSALVIAGGKEQTVWTDMERSQPSLPLCHWGKSLVPLQLRASCYIWELLHLLTAGNGLSEEGCTNQAALFLCRHVSSRHPGDGGGSFLSFGGAEEFGNGLGAGPGAGTEQGRGRGCAQGVGTTPGTAKREDQEWKTHLLGHSDFLVYGSSLGCFVGFSLVFFNVSLLL